MSSPEIVMIRFTLIELLNKFNSEADYGGKFSHLCPTITSMVRDIHNLSKVRVDLITNIFEVLCELSPDDFVEGFGSWDTSDVLECALRDYTHFANMSHEENSMRAGRIAFLQHLIANVGNVELEFLAAVRPHR
jgi:hypothetical protein